LSRKHKQCGEAMVQKSPGFLEKPNPLGFWVLLGFSDFLFERAVGKVVG